jgi:hypothetical protein
MTRPIFASSAVFLVNEREAVEGTPVDDAAAASPRPATSESVEIVEIVEKGSFSHAAVSYGFRFASANGYFSGSR